MHSGFVRPLGLFQGLILLLSLAHAPSVWALSSYANGATDETGSTGSAAVGLGVPDYAFVNDSGIGFSGNTDVFDVGEVAVFSFPTPLLAIAGQHDLVISAYVGGLGDTDNATVQVEVSSNGTIFSLAGTFDTQSARNRMQDTEENDHAGVKHFWIDFNGADNITHVRLTNQAGTAEGLRLDAIEGLHPTVDASHAFEVRFERVRADAEARFSIRIKNVSDAGGIPIREFRIDRPNDPAFMLAGTVFPLVGLDGNFICIENCSLHGGASTAFSRYVWSTDGVTEAALGLGLTPGRQTAHDLPFDVEIGTPAMTYPSGYTFTVTFTDGLVHVFDYDNDLLIAQGQLYQKYVYTDPAPIETGPRPVDYFEWRRRSMVTFSDPPSVGQGHDPGFGARLVATSQNFAEDGMHVESFWVPNDSTTFVQGHFHDLQDLYERSHGFESTTGLGPDRQGIYLERVDGGAFDLESLDYRPVGPLATTTLLISPTYDPSLPIAGQFTTFDVDATPSFETLNFTQFAGVTQLFILAMLGESQLERLDWDDFVIRTADPVSIAPTADAGPDLETTDNDEDEIEMVSLDGSASFDTDGTLTTWTWLDAGVVLGSGPMVDLLFAVGRHDVTLRVQDDDGNTNDDSLQVQVNPIDGLPFADAGPNQNVIESGGGSAPIVLDGSGSFDSNGTIVSWAWSELGVPLGIGETLALVLAVGVHVIELEVTDNVGNTATCIVTISVASIGGVAPIADAGSDVSVTDIDTDGSESVTLDGSGSTDPDGTITSWTWSEKGVPLGSGETLPVSFAVGVHMVDLVVQDDMGNSGVSAVTITVIEGVEIIPVGFVAHETSSTSTNTTMHNLNVATLPIKEGDLLLAHICADGGSGMAINCPANWILVEHASHFSDSVFGAICIKQADVTDESATSYPFTTATAQQTQSGVILIEDQDPLDAIDVSAWQGIETDTSPESPALNSPAPLPSSQVLRFMCANGGQVAEGVGFPAGMTSDLWILESADGLSGPVSSGAAVDGTGVSNAVEWTNALASSQQSVNFSVAIAGRVAPPAVNPVQVPMLSGPAITVLAVLSLVLNGALSTRRNRASNRGRA